MIAKPVPISRNLSYIGITTDPEKKRTETLLNHPNMINWAVVGPFDSKKRAKEWENIHPLGKKQKGRVNPGKNEAEWYGYSFKCKEHSYAI
ncbi:MAG: hypothetical protein ABII90_00520 [Bacteroidota bacterium]